MHMCCSRKGRRTESQPGLVGNWKLLSTSGRVVESENRGSSLRGEFSRSSGFRQYDATGEFAQGPIDADGFLSHT